MFLFLFVAKCIREKKLERKKEEEEEEVEEEVEEEEVEEEEEEEDGKTVVSCFPCSLQRVSRFLSVVFRLWCYGLILPQWTRIRSVLVKVRTRIFFEFQRDLPLGRVRNVSPLFSFEFQRDNNHPFRGTKSPF